MNTTLLSIFSTALRAAPLLAFALPGITLYLIMAGRDDMAAVAAAVTGFVLTPLTSIMRIFIHNVVSGRDSIFVPGITRRLPDGSTSQVGLEQPPQVIFKFDKAAAIAAERFIRERYPDRHDIFPGYTAVPLKDVSLSTDDRDGTGM